MKLPLPAKIILGLLLGYYVIVAFPLSYYLKSMIPEQAGNFIHGEIQLEGFSINPVTNSITVKGLVLLDQQQQKLLEFEQLYLNLDLLPLLLLNVHVNELSLTGLNVYASSNEKLLALNALNIDSVDVALNSHEVNIKSIALNKLSLNPRMAQDGTLNAELSGKKFEELLISSEENTPEPETPSPEWKVIVRAFSLTQGEILFTDETISSEAIKAAQTHVRNISLNAAPIHSDFSQDIQLKLGLDVFGGHLSVQGSVNPANKKSELTYKLSGLNLNQLNPYVNHFSYALIEQGIFETHGTLNSIEQVSKGDEAIPVLQLSLNNSSSIQKLAIRHQDFEERLLACELIGSEALQLELHLNKIDLDKILIDQCNIMVVMEKSGNSSANLAKALDTNSESKTNEQPVQSPETTGSPEWDISLQAFVINNTTFIFKDSSALEPVEVTVQKIQANVTPLQKGAKDLTQVSMTATINQNAPLIIQGHGNFVNPKLSSDINITLDKLGLKNFSPYMLGISGRPITKGVLTTNHSIKIDENKLDSHNTAKIENITLGRKQNIEGASKLPIALALNLLKNSKGEIHIDVPVSGNLDSPDFDIGKQVIKTLSGLITKAASAPFTLVGDLIPGGGNTQASQIAFETNSAVLSTEANKKIEHVAKTLAKHAELGLEINGFIGQQEKDQLPEADLLQLQVQRQQVLKNALLTHGISEAQLIFAEPIIAEPESAHQSGMALNFIVL